MTNNQTKTGDCECCNAKNIQITVHYGNMWMCDDCWKKEQAIVAEHQSPQAQQARVDAILAETKRVETEVRIKSDIFNAATVPIVELTAKVNADSAIENKQFAIAEILLARFQERKAVIFERRQELLQLENEQRAIQIHLNQLALQLRKEERDRLKLADLNYQPSTPKEKKPPAEKRPSISKQLQEIRKYAAEYGVDEVAVRTLTVAKNLTPEKAAQLVKGMMNP